jgi:hypothetical protein
MQQQKKAYMFEGKAKLFIIIVCGRFIDLITPMLGQFNVT